jgi:hypothetical protein
MAFRRDYVVIGFTLSHAREEQTMSPISASRARRIVSRITATWAEMDHAQRRMLEIQTGIPGPSRRHARKPRWHNNEHDTQL